MQAEPPPTPEEQDASLERLREEEATRYPDYADADERRERVGLGDQRPEPDGPPPPLQPERGAATPSADEDR